MWSQVKKEIGVTQRNVSNNVPEMLHFSIRPAEPLEALTRPLEYFDRLKDRGELKIPKE